MKLPSVPGAISGVRDRWRARGSSAATDADLPRETRQDAAGLPMPLALQGVLELLAVAVVGLVLGALLLGAVWAAGGFATLGAGGSLRLAGLGWLLAHGAPVTVHAVEGLSLPGPETVNLVPLGLTLIPFGLAVVAGRRIARACWRGQFLLPFFTGMAAYAVFAAAVAWACRTDQVSVDLPAAALCSLLPVGLGTLVGGWSVSRSLAAVLGTDAASWLQRTSQYSRWAGSYVWAVLRAGFLAAVTAVAGGALLLTVAFVANWDRIIAVHQDLGTGAAGDTALTAMQLGLLPNMVLWALAWATGAGFSVGAGTLTSPFHTTLGPLPQFPALAALPTGDPWAFAPAVLALPVLAGLLAGWWFCREGENHLDDWMAIRLPLRWFTFLVSTLVTVVLIAAVGSGLASLLVWLSHGSLGIGRLTDVGPHAGTVFLWLGAELAVGAAVGYVLGPWLEREGYRSRDDHDAAAGHPEQGPVAERARPVVTSPAPDGARQHHAVQSPEVHKSATGEPAVRDLTEQVSAGDAAGRPRRVPAWLSRTEVPKDPARAPAAREDREETTSDRSRGGAVRTRQGDAAASPAPDTARSAPRPERRAGSSAVVRGAGASGSGRPGLSRREEARQRRSAKRKAARLAALDRENER
ncbi:DUF6350 family protein [Kocuria sp.]|uniref:cell division protein PerM n=1 Tax=Kocuria sp. TaxID=1871328 RepID=UPI0026DB0965|nr:DUF6350 family protein [Kocuria sp.]MDO4919320.1 DUF6350 family protein [Kocuria sp.]